MASVSAIQRTVACVYGRDGSGFIDELAIMAAIPALIDDVANTVNDGDVGLYIEEYWWQDEFGAYQFGRMVRLDFFLTEAGDAVVVGNLNDFSTAIDMPLRTWSVPISFGW